MQTRIEIGDITANVTHKEIKNIHLSVYPPEGEVKISAPLHLSMDTIRVFALSKLQWIRKEQQKFREQERETPREYLNRESHYVWGERYMLVLAYADVPASVHLKHNKLMLTVRPHSSKSKKQEVLEAWYRQQLRDRAEVMLQKWEEKLGVKTNRVIIQKMKTKWGSCSPKTRIIRLNLELAKKPQQYLEYIIVHELIHLIEPTHNKRFTDLMNAAMPKWKHYREELNRLTLSVWYVKDEKDRL